MPATEMHVDHIAQRLYQQLQRYIEAQYPIRDRGVLLARRALLQNRTVLAQEPYIETTAPYPAGNGYSSLELPYQLGKQLDALAGKLDLPSVPYAHQEKALREFFVAGNDLIVATGTGSGKTETFMVPILARLIAEAMQAPHTFNMPGCRALILYPMNALVTDQLSRLRRIFGNVQLQEWLNHHARTMRPPRFGMYTSRTPYAGVASPDNDKQKLLPLLENYLNMSPKTRDALRRQGKWPEADLEALHQAILAKNYDALPLPGSRELFTRLEMQQWCPDILVTNYSMLEYMLLRPIEASIFDQTAAWLAASPENTLLLVLDEAHLYNGSLGTEIKLLIERLCLRLEISRERLRCILTSASLKIDEAMARSFADALVGAPPAKRVFSLITAQRQTPAEHAHLIPDDLTNPAEQIAQAFAECNASYIAQINGGKEESAQALSELQRLAVACGWPMPPTGLQEIRRYLGEHLITHPLVEALAKQTRDAAQSASSLAHTLFPMFVDNEQRNSALSTLLTLIAFARRPHDQHNDQPLLPVRLHLFLRGLPSIFACINPGCTERQIPADADESGLHLGRLYLEPRVRCDCGGRVYELMAHRYCGALFLRVFSAKRDADFYWHEAGEDREAIQESKLLLDKPHSKTSAKGYEKVYIDSSTGRAWSNTYPSTVDPVRLRICWRAISTSGPKTAQPDENEGDPEWKSCPVCRRQLRAERSISTLATRGEEPFAAIIRETFSMLPPQKPVTRETPNAGRKLLLFADGRQPAARMARDLPRWASMETFTQALVVAAQRLRALGKDPILNQRLYTAFAIVCAEHHLHFFDGDHQRTFLRHMAELQRDYHLDLASALDDEWDDNPPPSYHLEILRQVAAPYHSLSHYAIALLTPKKNILGQLHNDPVLSRLKEDDLYLSVCNWIDDLLDLGAFDASIGRQDRMDILGFPCKTFTLATNPTDSEDALKEYLGLKEADLKALRQVLASKLCKDVNGQFFLEPAKLMLDLTLNDQIFMCKTCGLIQAQGAFGRCRNAKCRDTALKQLAQDDPFFEARYRYYRLPVEQAKDHNIFSACIDAEEHTAQLSYRDNAETFATTETYELRFQDILLDEESSPVDVLSCTTTMEVGIDIGAVTAIGLRNVPPARANYQQRAGRAGRRSAEISLVVTFAQNRSHDQHYYHRPASIISAPPARPFIPKPRKQIVRRHVSATLIQRFFREHLSAQSTSPRQADLYSALGTTKEFFCENGKQSLQSFLRWVDKQFTAAASSEVTVWLAMLTQQYDATLPELQSWLHEAMENLTKSKRDELLQQTADVRQKTKGPMLLDTLMDEGLIPSYSFPRNVRSFVIEKQGPNQRIEIEERPDRSADLALSEYAPGRLLVVKKKTYRVGGIYVGWPGQSPQERVPAFFQKDEHFYISTCQVCRYQRFDSLPYEHGDIRLNCPICKTEQALQQLEYIDPPGYAPAEAREVTDEMEQQDLSYGGRVTFPTPATPEGFTWHDGPSPLLQWTTGEHQKFIVMNDGPSGKGFSICQECGAAKPADNKPAWQKTHQRPFLVPSYLRAASHCPGGTEWRGALGFHFFTDVFVLRVHLRDPLAPEREAAWVQDAFTTLAEAMAQGASRILDIGQSDVTAGWRYAPEGNAIDLFLLDTLSGGAGYATMLHNVKERLFDEMVDILTNCPVGCDRSCYHCLRSYDNQMLHARLDRHLAARVWHTVLTSMPAEPLDIATQERLKAPLADYFRLQKNQDGLAQIPNVIVYPVELHERYRQTAGKIMLSDYDLQRNLPAVASAIFEGGNAAPFLSFRE